MNYVKTPTHVLYDLPEDSPIMALAEKLVEACAALPHGSVLPRRQVNFYFDGIDDTSNGTITPNGLFATLSKEYIDQAITNQLWFFMRDEDEGQLTKQAQSLVHRRVNLGGSYSYLRHATLVRDVSLFLLTVQLTRPDLLA